jgi:hypothetical protein
VVELWGLRWDREYSHSDNFITEETSDLVATFITEETSDLVATFDTMETARDYVKKSLLKAAKKDQYFRADPYRGKFKYRKNSLFRWYTDYEIEGAEESVPPPHNPTLED